MDEKSNTSQGPEQSPQFTLFGKRMGMEDSETPASDNAEPKVYLGPGDEDAEERRTFWLVVGTAALILGGVLLSVGVQYFRSRTAAPASPAAQRPVEAPPAPPAQAPQPKPAEPPAPAQAGAPAPSPTAGASAASAPAPGPPSGLPAQKGLVAPAAPATEARREAPQKAEERASRAAAAAGDGGAAPRRARQARASARRATQPDPYIERLRKELEQYEREKTQGKYREFPR